MEAGRYSVAKYKGSEAVYVSNVNIIGSDWSSGMNKVTITFRIPVMTILKCYPCKCFLYNFFFVYSETHKLVTNLLVELGKRVSAVSSG